MWEARQNQFGTYVVENGNCICSIEGDLNRADKMKNANLIAATHDLLDALIACNDAMEYMSEYDIPITLPQQVKDAIAKATGNNQ